MLFVIVCCSLLWSTCNVDSAVIRDTRRGATGPLSDYVYRPDSNYQWSVYSRTQQSGYTTVYLSLTSQRWFDANLSSRPIWQHYVVVHVPDVIQYPDAAFLHVTGGENPSGPPTDIVGVIRTGEFARSTGIVAAALVYVPNQPVILENDGKSRVEDDIVAWTWRRFYNESVAGINNPEILLYMPMCKASVRAMDAVQDFVQQETGRNIAKFMVSGESKRGLTTWLTGAIDNRVVALAPVVYTALNYKPNFHHYWQSLGGWSFALFDYWSQGMMGVIDSPQMAQMMKILDPYEYRQWLTMPKLMISGGSDEFFMPDDYDYFFSSLSGEKYIWIIENIGHYIGSSAKVDDYWSMLGTFYVGVLKNYAIPSMTWTKTSDATKGSIEVNLGVTPVRITAFSTTSVVPNRRDFRAHQLDGNSNMVATNIVWTESGVTNLGGGRYQVLFDTPADGYRAFFIKVRLPGPDGREYTFSTEVNIIPSPFPNADCSGSGCYGSLV